MFVQYQQEAKWSLKVTMFLFIRLDNLAHVEGIPQKIFSGEVNHAFIFTSADMSIYVLILTMSLN